MQRDDTAPTPTVSPSLPAWAQTPGDPDTPYWQTLIQTRYPAARVLLLDDGQLGRLITVLERMGGRLTMAAQQARQEHSDAYPQRQAEADLVAAVTARLRDQAMEQQAITDAQEAAR